MKGKSIAKTLSM